MCQSSSRIKTSFEVTLNSNRDSSYISIANLLLTVPVILTLYVIFHAKKHWTAVVHINSSDTYACSAGVH